MGVQPRSRGRTGQRESEGGGVPDPSASPNTNRGTERRVKPSQQFLITKSPRERLLTLPRRGTKRGIRELRCLKSTHRFCFAERKMNTIRKISKRLGSYLDERKHQRYAKRWMQGKLGASWIAPLPRRRSRDDNRLRLLRLRRSPRQINRRIQIQPLRAELRHYLGSLEPHGE